MAKAIQDQFSAEWLVVKKHCEDRLAELRLENDNDLNERETSIIRGKIEAMKEILDLDSAEQKIEVVNTKYIE